MSNRQPNANSGLKRARRWRPSPESLAAVSAARGDPSALLALDAYTQHDPQGTPRERPERPADVAPDSTRS
jgi:hypothetical protein